MRKVFVEVIAKFMPNGQIIPLTVIWEDGRQYEITKVIDTRKAASLKVGGQGLRYTCRINCKDTYLWLEEGKWFVEGK